MRFVEIGQIFVVGENLDRKGGTVEVVPPGFESTDDSKEFTIIDVIISFCQREGLSKV